MAIWVVHIDELIGEGEGVVALGYGEANAVFNRPYKNDYAFVFYR